MRDHKDKVVGRWTGLVVAGLPGRGSAASGELEIVNCGHMAPPLVHGDNATYVGQGGLLLGVPMREPHPGTQGRTGT